MHRLAPYIALLLLSPHFLVPCRAQSAPAPQASLLTRKAGLIFSGQVIRVEPVKATGKFVQTMSITFKVDHAIRGAHVGQRISIREWIGLWQNGNERYRPGQRTLLFLYPHSKVGLTSPVGGRLGRFAIDARDNIRLQPQQLNIFNSPAENVFQLRTRNGTVIPYREFVRALRLTGEK